MTWLGVGLCVVVVGTLPFLALAGLRTVDDLKSEHARIVTDDPDAPGFEAFIEPTPTAIAVTVGANGEHLGSTFLAAGSAGGGGALLVPPRMVVSVPTLSAPWMTPPAEGDQVGVIYDMALEEGGIDGLRSVTEEMLGVVTDSVTELGPAEWEALLAGVGALTVRNRIEVQIGTTTYPVGELELTAAEAAAWVTLPAEQANGSDAMARQEDLWRALFAAVEVAGPEAVPGEADRGLASVIRLLAAGAVTYPDFPIHRVQVPPDTEFDSPALDELDELMVRMVPYAVGAGGDRISMRILDGIDQDGIELEAADLLAPIGVDLQRIGNAQTYDHEESRIIYYDSEMKEQAQLVRDTLGVGALELAPSPTSELDVTVVVGRDFAALGGDA